VTANCHQLERNSSNSSTRRELVEVEHGPWRRVGGNFFFGYHEQRRIRKHYRTYAVHFFEHWS